MSEDKAENSVASHGYADFVSQAERILIGQYCMTTQGPDAEQAAKDRYEVARAYLENVEMLRFFFGQMQMHDARMDGKHRYRFVSGGWPMTHCVGASREEAVESAMREIERERSESA